ncbi:MAG: MlaD family protein [Victivallaceae bacterium]
MSEKSKSLSKVPEAKIVVKKRTRFSLVWVIPIVAAVAGIWIVVTNILNRGPEITIVFQSADGLEAQKTKIKYNGLDIGVIKSIRLSENHKSIIATAQMSPNMKDLLVEDSKFWVVRPRITGMAITGLGTLISGDYVGMQLGKSQQKAFAFIALETPPLTGDTPGRVFTLKTPELGSLGISTPVFFRQLQVGQIVSYELDKNGKFLNVKIFVQSPYDQYVNADTRFWQASGIEVSMSANGINIKTESLLSILAGGVTFETPETRQAPLPVDAGATFNLFDDRAEAFKPPVCDPRDYVLVFKQSVRGLTKGAPVQFYGITIGEVTKISPQVDMAKMESCVQVTVSVDPKRYGVKFMDLPASENKVEAHKKLLNALVARGFRAQLNTGNLLTGSLLVSFDFSPEAPTFALDWSQKPLQLPTIPNTLSSIENSAAALLKNLNQAAVDARCTISNTDKLLNNADKLFNNANQLIEPNSVMNAELNNLLQQGSGAARALRVLADYLERHPEALILGKKGEAK